MLLLNKVATGGGGGYALIQHVSGGSPSAGTITLGPINTASPSAATLIIVAGGWTTSTPTDNRGNTYLSAATGTVRAQLYYCASPAGTGAGHTFTIPSGYPAAFVEVYTGGAGGILDKTSVGTYGATPARPGSVTPSTNGQLCVTAMDFDETSGTATIAVDSGFAQPDPALLHNTGNYYAGAVAYLIQATAAPVNPGWTDSVAGSQAGAIIATFK